MNESLKQSGHPLDIESGSHGIHGRNEDRRTRNTKRRGPVWDPKRPCGVWVQIPGPGPRNAAEQVSKKTNQLNFDAFLMLFWCFSVFCSHSQCFSGFCCHRVRVSSKVSMECLKMSEDVWSLLSSCGLVSCLAPGVDVVLQFFLGTGAGVLEPLHNTQAAEVDANKTSRGAKMPKLCTIIWYYLHFGIFWIERGLNVFECVRMCLKFELFFGCDDHDGVHLAGGYWDPPWHPVPQSSPATPSLAFAQCLSKMIQLRYNTEIYLWYTNYASLIYHDIPRELVLPLFISASVKDQSYDLILHERGV